MGEGAMRLIKRTIQVCKLLKLPFEEEIYRQLSGYRATVNLATGFSPAELAGVHPYPLYQLGDDPDVPGTPAPMIDREDLEKAVTANKKRGYPKGKNIRPHSFKVGQKVLVNLDSRKHDFKYELDPYTITNIKGSSIEAVNADGKEILRDSTKFKAFELETSDKEDEKETLEPEPENSTTEPTDHVDPADSAPDVNEAEATKDQPKRRNRQDGAASPQPWILPTTTRTRRK